MNERNVSLDFLRFAAAMIVAVPHLIIFFKLSDHAVDLEIMTSMGVEVFFALSGFVLAPLIFRIVTTHDAVYENTRIFFIRRWMRTLPLFFFSAVLHFVIFDPDWNLHAFSYFLFLQNFAWSTPNYDYFSVSWSLAIEEWYYVVLPLYLIACRRYIHKNRPLNENSVFIYTAAFVLVFIGLKAVYPSTGEEWGAELRRVTVFRLDAIAFGALTFLLVQRRSFLVNPAVLAISLPLQAWLVYLLYVRILSGEATHFEANVLVFILSATFSCALVAFAHVADRWMPVVSRPASLWGGRISYGIYLFHIPIGVMITIVPADLLPGGSWQVVVAVLALWTFTAIIYQIFERPILINRPIYVGRR